MEKKIESYQSAEILNLPEMESTAIIVTKVCQPKKNIIYTIKINDCHKEIVLHGVLNTEEGRENAMYKLNTLINELGKLESHIEKVCKENPIT